MKNYIGISLDTSASMRGIALAAGRDYNSTIEAINEGANEHNIDTIVSVVNCGVGREGSVERVVVNSSVGKLKPIKDGSYTATGHYTPLFKSVEELISLLEAVPDANDPDVTFVLNIITDGGENVYSDRQVASVVKKMNDLSRTDRWTFSFRVPNGYARQLANLGIPSGNIMEWEQTDKGVAASSAKTRDAFKQFYAARSAGVRSTDKFYADLSTVSLKEVKAQLVDISKQVDVYVVDKRNDGVQIRDFVEAQGVPYVKGCAFYQLNKTETVQDYKQIAIRDKIKGAVYSGFAARDMLGLSQNGDIKLAPGQHGQYEIFIQSTSFNRKLVAGTNLMVWANVSA
jgi:hypothetical protein